MEVGNIGNFLENDQNLLQNNDIDRERKIVVKQIELENNFYNLFRNTLKILINYDENKEKREEILRIVNDITMSYLEKIENIKAILQELMSTVIKFQHIDLTILEDYEDFITCLGLNKSSCDKETHCFMRTESGICRLLLPKKNFFSKSDNEYVYFLKLTDEIIRYSKIRKYIFTPRTFLSFEHVNYKINDEEIILLEEILLDKYLDNIELRESNKYIKTTKIYELTNPTITSSSIRYTSNVHETECYHYTKDKPWNTSTLENLFIEKIKKSPSHMKRFIEIEQYDRTGICAFKMIQFILENNLQTQISISNIKTTLTNEYLKLKVPQDTKLEISSSYWKAKDMTLFSVFNYHTFQKECISAVQKQLKENKSKEIKKQISLASYFPTEFDLFLIFKFYKIPFILKVFQTQGPHTNTIYLNRNISELTNAIDTNNHVYMIIINNKIIPRRVYSSFFLIKYKNKYKIPQEIIDKNLLKTKSLTINEFITSSIKDFEEKQVNDRKKGQKGKQEWRKKQKEKLKKKPKKLGRKKKLPSKK